MIPRCSLSFKNKAQVLSDVNDRISSLHFFDIIEFPDPFLRGGFPFFRLALGGDGFSLDQGGPLGRRRGIGGQGFDQRQGDGAKVTRRGFKE